MKLVLLLLPLGLAACSSELPPLKGHVVDDASVLDDTLEARLEQRLAQHQQTYYHQVVVVTLYSLNKEPIEKIARRLSEGWAIGVKAGYRGVLLLVAPRDHQLYIDVGVGLKPVLGDTKVQHIINSVILPRFQQGQLQQGVEQGVDAILKAITPGESAS